MMKIKAKSKWIAALSLVCVLCIALAVYLQTSTFATEMPPIVNGLTQVSYTVSDNSGNEKGSVNVSALGGKEIYLGPAHARRYFAQGLSMLAVSQTEPATLTIPVSPDAGYTMFTTDYGIDAASEGTQATFVFFVNGEEHTRQTLTSDEFHKKFEISTQDVTEIRMEVYAEENTCVSLGDPNFYTASPNAVSMITENVTLGGWPVPIQRNANLYGNALKIGAKDYKYGFCVNSVASFDLVLDQNYFLFTAEVGIDEGVAGGSHAGSVVIQAAALDKDGKVLFQTETPVLYGNMSAYSLQLVVDGAERIRFAVKDGGNGIADDMAVIANPALSLTLGKNTVFLSELKVPGYSVGGDTLGIDRNSQGGAFSYQIGGDTLTFQKGVGMRLKNASYQDYLLAKVPENYAYADFDISATSAKSVEMTAIVPTGAGAYLQIFADGQQIGDDVFVNSLENGGAPMRIWRSLPESTQTLRIVLVGKDSGGGNVDLVNARVYGDNEGLQSVAVSETVSAAKPYPYGRNQTPLGKELALVTGSGTQGVSSGIALMANSSVTFYVNGGARDMFTAILGLQKGSTGSAVFTVTAHKTDGSESVYTSPAVTDVQQMSFFTGENVEKLTLSVSGDDNLVGVFGECSFFASEFQDKERISDLDWIGYANGWGNICVDTDLMGLPINVAGTIYERGISMHAFNDPKEYSYVAVNVPQGYGYTVFASRIGVNKDTTNNGTSGSVKFYVEGDGKILYASNLMRVTDEAQFILVDITGVSNLVLKVDNGDGSYECDFAVWVDPVIAKSTDHLDDYMRLDSPIANQSAAVDGQGVFTVQGILLGSSHEAEVFVNGSSVGKASADKNTGVFVKDVAITQVGRNTIRVVAGNLTEERNVFIAGEKVDCAPVTLSTNSTTMKIRPLTNGVAIESLRGTNGHEWAGENTFVRFPDEIRLGGEGGTPYTLQWKFVSHEQTVEQVVSKDVDVFKNDYVGDLITETFTYVDQSGRFTLKSVWTAQQDYVGPIMHSIDFINNSDEIIYVTTADTLTATFLAPKGAEVTSSYAYKGPMYQTSYGYRQDTVTDGYDMEVFSSTDYNNGMQIDAGYIPWVSLFAEDQGLNIGVYWSDCRVHVHGVSGGAYVEAGLRPRFRTEIQPGDTYKIPASFVDVYDGSIDDGSNQLKKYLFAFSMPEVNRVDDSLPKYGANLWELLDTTRRAWRMDDSKFYEGVHQLAEAGIQEIVIDTYWWKDIGDWRGVHEKWESSMTYSSNYVHALGMDFMIYMQAGNGSSLHTDSMTGIGIAANPNWFARGENLFWDELCLADEDAFAFISEYLPEYLMELGLDGMRTDFGYIIGVCLKEGHDHVDDRDDVGYWTSMRCYELLDKMYEMFPVPEDVNSADSEAKYFKWENCNCGGTLKDFMSLSKATRIQLTDAYDALNFRRAFYDASYVFPTMQLMNWMNDWMYNPDGHFPDEYFFYSLIQSTPTLISCMPSDMSPEMYNTFVRSIEIYNDWVQELIKYGDLYHSLGRPDGINWDGTQYYNPDTGKGALFAFKPDPNGTISDTQRFVLHGLDPKQSYYVWSENGTIPFATYTGKQLAQGLDITLEGSYRAEIVYFMATNAAGVSEVVASPKAFDLSVNVAGGKVSAAVKLCENADYYVFTISDKQGKPVYSFIAQDLEAKQNVFEGLQAGEYVLTVTAINRFGNHEVSCEFTVDASSVFADRGYAVTGGDKGGLVLIDGTRYLNGQTLDLSDTQFGLDRSRTLTVKNLAGQGKLNLRLALGVCDRASEVLVQVYGQPGNTLLATQRVTGAQAYVDITANTAGCESVTVVAQNVSADVYTQSALGYGRIGLYGGKNVTDYAFSADVTLVRNGLNETYPRAGLFAGYVDDNQFLAFYIDAYYSNIVIYERTNGQSSDKTTNIKMEAGFDYYAEHSLKVVRSGNHFAFYVDGKLVDERTVALGPSKIALITEDAMARFANVTRIIAGAEESITWSQKSVNVNIYGATIYSTRVTQGLWERIKPRLQIVLY